MALAWLERTITLRRDWLRQVEAHFAQQGDSPEAREQLARARGMVADYVQGVAKDPRLEGLKELPRFKALVGAGE